MHLEAFGSDPQFSPFFTGQDVVKVLHMWLRSFPLSIFILQRGVDKSLFQVALIEMPYPWKQ